MCLHSVFQSNRQSEGLSNCLAVLQPEDALLLVGDGVYAAFEMATQLPSCYLLADDWQLRAPLQTLPEHIQAIDYPRWVELAIAHSKSITWA